MRGSIKKHYRRAATKRKIIVIGGIAAAAVIILGGGFIAFIVRDLPTPEDLFSRRVIQSTKIYDRTGAVLLYEIHGEEKRTVIPFAEIPAAVKNATVAIEDANFYNHAGIDLKGILRALLVDITSGNLNQGGSTITQQLVKNSLIGNERTIQRKIKEAILAIILETRLSKEKILDLYLNQIPYGSNSYGIEAAAETFFGTHARELTVAEASLLAALPRAPSYYSPYGQHKDELLKRKDAVIDRMTSLGYLSPDEASRARSEALTFLPATKNIRAPHFVMFVRDYLVSRYGEEEVEQGGLVVTTTLDWKLQQAAEEIVVKGAARNEQLIQAHNMALVAIDPKSGEILAMVGSRDYFDIANDGNFNVTTALRQPGSAFKPFVYATAFKRGFRPETVLFDVPTEFNPLCTPDGLPRPGTTIATNDCYHPQNYDEKFRGPVTLRQAIAQSLNVPSVKVLYLAGIDDSIRTAEDLGITSLTDRARFGLSLVLGGAEVRLLEMTSAYGVFANDGVLNPPAGILRVETANRQVLEEKQENMRPAIDPEIARTINDVISDNDARIPIFQPHSSLYFPERTVAVKTGTTQDYRDAWTIGYTPSIAVGVWAGNNDNSPMQQKGSGVMAAAPSWREFMDSALQNFPPEEFIPPNPVDVLKPVLKGVWQGDTVVTIDTISGKRATEFTPPETRKDLAFGTPHDPLYWIDRSDPTGPPPPNPSTDPQYPNWETALARWLESSNFVPQPLARAPSGSDDIHTPENQPKITIKNTFKNDVEVVIEANVEAVFGLKEAVLFTSDQILSTITRPSGNIRFSISLDGLHNTRDPLGIRVYDVMGNIGTAAVPL